MQRTHSQNKIHEAKGHQHQIHKKVHLQGDSHLIQAVQIQMERLGKEVSNNNNNRQQRTIARYISGLFFFL